MHAGASRQKGVATKIGRMGCNAATQSQQSRCTSGAGVRAMALKAPSEGSGREVGIFNSPLYYCGVGAALVLLTFLDLSRP